MDEGEPPELVDVDGNGSNANLPSYVTSNLQDLALQKTPITIVTGIIPQL